jgi:hypothetical protein
MEQQKAMEYGSRKVSSDVVNPRNIYKSYEPTVYSEMTHSEQP